MSKEKNYWEYSESTQQLVSFYIRWWWICWVYSYSCFWFHMLNSWGTIVIRLITLHVSFWPITVGFFPTVEAAFHFGCGCFCWARAPLVVCCVWFAFFLTKRKSGWGICGSSAVVVLCLWFLWCGCCICIWPQCHVRIFVLMTLIFLLGPSLWATSAKPEEKKSAPLLLCLFLLALSSWLWICLFFSGGYFCVHRLLRRWLSSSRPEPWTGLCCSFFFGRHPLPFGGSPLEAYPRTSGESNHHRQSVSDTRVPPYQLSHEDTWTGLCCSEQRWCSVKYSIQSFKWKPTPCAKSRKLLSSKKHFQQSPKAAKGWCAFFWQQTIKPPDETKWSKATSSWVQAATDMHPACPNKKQNHLQNILLWRTQFWVFW